MSKWIECSEPFQQIFKECSFYILASLLFVLSTRNASRKRWKVENWSVLMERSTPGSLCLFYYVLDKKNVSKINFVAVSPVRCSKYIFYEYFFGFTLYPALSRVGRGNLMLRHCYFDETAENDKNVKENTRSSY